MTENEQEHEPSLRKKSHNAPIFAVLLIVIGIIFLLNNYGFSNIDIGKLWPLILIIVGIGAVLSYKNH